MELWCPDLDAAIAFYVDELGFRLDMIMPADAPRIAVLSGHGISIRLEAATGSANTSAIEVPDDAQLVRIVRSAGDDAWIRGRAGMHYRDLVPGRMGGRFIASHIRIDEGGPVPDYVHYHRVRFQMIYCRRGWVRVVYEDQGEPFVMQTGDCVLQPPQIRHRVLESSAGLEVIEIGCPAEHETLRDHDMSLPTRDLRAERPFDGQKFQRHEAGASVWQRDAKAGVAFRDLGIARATAGLASARVWRLNGDRIALGHDGEIRFVMVLSGQITLNSASAGVHILENDDACTIPAGELLYAEAKSDCELLEVSLPAR